ncbi:MAG: hypothetical protein HYR85_26195 [Planctomycetes bacterium]|nr:hypothetical protein [Planctomycetota bacterium]MBI3846947.1 hypothetical protein [Planctomycetota bacterium]
MYQARLKKLGVVLMAPFALILLRLVWLQVVTASEHRTKARRSGVPSEPILGHRGTISDRKGRPLEWDEGAFDLNVKIGYYEAGTAIGCVSCLLRDLHLPPEDGLPGITRDPATALAMLLATPAASVAKLPGKARYERALRRLQHVFGCNRKKFATALATPSGTLADAWRRAAELDHVTANPAAVLDRMRAEAAALSRLDAMLGPDETKASLATLLEQRARDAECDVREREMLYIRDDDRERDRVVREAHMDSPLRPRTIARTVDRSAAFEVFLHPTLYPGIEPVMTSVRRAAPEAPAQVLRGLDGERRELVAGANGETTVVRSALGQEREVLDYVPPKSGCDLELTLDLDVQHAAEAALGPRNGAAVVMDCRTGEVLALASSPTLSLDDVRKRWSELAAMPGEPIFDKATHARSVGGSYPGSTFKVVATVAALEDAAFDPATRFECLGYLHEPNLFRCTGTHGSLDLHTALVRSCNVYFYNLGERIGGERLAVWGARFGFGRRTGIEVVEDAGHLFAPPGTTGLPSLDRYPRQGIHERGRSWTKSDSRFLAIGQVDVEATPLQVCRMIAAIGAGGRLVSPHIVRRVGDGAGAWGPPVTPTIVDLHLSASTLRILQAALRGVVFEEGGTAFGKGLDGFEVAGKSGTAEHADRTGKLPDHAWFACYAPASSPQVAVTVFLDSAGEHGGAAAAPLVAPILDAYFASLKSRPAPEESR